MEASKKGKRVLLFKAPKDGEPDQFVEELKHEGYSVACIPVLEFSLVNIPVYTECLQHPDKYSAIVFTSQRSVEATAEAIRPLHGLADSPPSCLGLQCYVVGASTHKAAQAAGFCPVEFDSGNAEKLAEFIIKDLAVSDKPVMYPCGNLRQETLPKQLTEAGYSLKEIVVYETKKSTAIESLLQQMIEQQGLPDVVVYFSPSGVNYTFPLISTHLSSLRQTKVIAIGPSTERALKERQIEVTGVCTKPDPSSLRTTIQQRTGVHCNSTIMLFAGSKK